MVNSLVAAAPPPSREAVTGGVPVTKIKTKLSSNKIVPAVESPLDLREESGHGDRAETDLRPFLVSHHGHNKNDGLADNLPAFPPKKAWQDSNDDHRSLPLRTKPVISSHSNVERGIAVRQTSPPEEVAHLEMDEGESSTSPPPYILTTTAWGNLSTLDNNIDSISALNKKNTAGTGSQNGVYSLGNAYTDSVGYDTEGMNDNQTGVNYQLPLDTHSHQQAISSPQSDNSSSFKDEGESITDEDHFRSLQEASSAKLVAVSPAPREQRTTFAAHKQSKLSSAEAGGKVYDFDFSPRSAEKGAGLESYSIAYNSDAGHGENGLHENGLHGEIPEANLKLVLSQQKEEEQRVSTSRRKSSPEFVVSGNHAGTTKEEEVIGEQIHGEKEKKKSSEQNLVKRDDIQRRMKETSMTAMGDKVSAKENSEGRKVDPNRRKRKKKKLTGNTESQVWSGDPIEENSHHATIQEDVSVVHDEDKMSSLLQEVSTSSYNQAVKTVHSTSVSRVGDEELRALKDIDIHVPLLKEVEHTDIYIGKCHKIIIISGLSQNF